MAKTITLMVVIVVLLSSVSAAQAQVISVTPKTGTDVVPPGQKSVYAVGTYTLMPGQTVDKVVAKWYQQVGNNLNWVADTTDNNPANNTYTTGSVGVDATDGMGQTILYTVIVQLWLRGGTSPAAYSAFQNFKP